MSFFYSIGGGQRTIRPSYSWLQPARVEEGVRRLARLVEAVR
jgi:(S)-3,5-dihydroxyphenylglycine transaminase